MGMQTGAATVENSMEFSQTTKNGAAVWSRNSTSGDLPEEIENSNLKTHITPVSTAALFTTVKLWKQPKCPPVGNWIKMWYLHTMNTTWP